MPIIKSKSKNNNKEGTRPLTGASPTQPYKCGQYFKTTIKSGFDFDFNILTAFIRLGRARPAGAGCPPNCYYFFYFLTLLFDFPAP